MLKLVRRNKKTKDNSYFTFTWQQTESTKRELLKELHQTKADKRIEKATPTREGTIEKAEHGNEKKRSRICFPLELLMFFYLYCCGRVEWLSNLGCTGRSPCSIQRQTCRLEAWSSDTWLDFRAGTAALGPSIYFINIAKCMDGPPINTTSHKEKKKINIGGTPPNLDETPT